MRRSIIVVIALVSVLLAGCGDDDGGDEPAALSLTLTETAIEGLPEEVEAGVVNVTVTDQTEAAGGDVNFTLVEDGTDPATFAEDLAANVFSGESFPDYFLNNSGVIGSGLLTLKEGEYIVWIDLASDLDRPSTAEDVVTSPLTVAGGDDDAELPDADGTITASDYAFEVDLSAGPSTVNFVNDGPDQLHHAVVVDFGTNDPAAIEENLPAILESEEDAPPPEGIDMEQVNFEFASSAVFGPDSGGTFDADFVAGNTYAVLCFIQDRAGGPPHAIAYQMYDVFQVEGE
jgi:hypothetical protein